jgi:hypothetical protein
MYAAVATALILWLLRTCTQPRPQSPLPEPDPVAADLAAAFDPARCGTVRATVRWSGAVPVVPPIELIAVANAPGGADQLPNPNTPRIRNGTLADAVVYLSGIDVRRSRPWDLSPVSVEARMTGLAVKQGEQTGRVAIVRRGAPVELVSREHSQHSVQARGAAFFTQMLHVPDHPISRTLSDAGLVELSSGSGYYWLRGYLLVSDHPYAAASGPDGAINLPQVPDGEYEASCWVPNWHVERRENDPERLVPVRLVFGPPVGRRQRVVVTAGGITDLVFTLSAEDFGR